MRIFFLLAVLGTAWGAEPVTETHTYPLAAEGTVRLTNAVGNVSIEGWDQPRVEVTTIKTAEDRRVLDRVKVTAEAGANLLSLATAFRKYPRIERPFRWTLNFGMEYRIKAPRTARLAIEEYAGEVNVQGMSGDIRATDRNGDIFLLLPEGKYAIDARSKVGGVVSDFEGRGKRNRGLVGEEFSGGGAGRKLVLRVGFGDVMILRMRTAAGD